MRRRVAEGPPPARAAWSPSWSPSARAQCGSSASARFDLEGALGRPAPPSGETDVAILFTDLVGFSSWALEAGDTAALELLGEVEEVEESAVRRNGGVLVKRLGDGSMAVFNDADEAIEAALDAQAAAAKVEAPGYRAQLRAGIHLGRPRKVGGDFLGVDVNIAARVADAAKGGEVLVSDAVLDAVEPRTLRLGHERRAERRRRAR